MRVAVAGGTGLTGSQVVRVLESRGHEPVVLARSRGVDLLSGAGVDDALAGVAAVIDVTDVRTTNRRTSLAFFDAATRTLLAAGQHAGVRHHIGLSIVGIDRVDFGYYEGKRRQEELITDGPLPWTVLRATQFHEFAGRVLESVPGPVAVVPRMRTRPIAVREVAVALASLVDQPPLGRVFEAAGPREEFLPDMARRLLRARGSGRRVLAVRLPMSGGREMADGGLLPTGPGLRGEQTFDKWLAAGAGDD